MTFSIVIATRDRPAKLARVLAALANQTWSGGWDVVVVDNSPRHAGPSVPAGALAALGLRGRVLREPRPGWARAKNLGCRAARGEFILSLDDDCYPDEGYLRAWARAIEETGADFIAARIAPCDPSDLHAAATRDFAVRYHPPFRPVGGGVWGGNMAFRRSLFDRLGGFDLEFGPGGRFGGGDLEFAERAVFDGAMLAWHPAPTVRHDDGRTSAIEWRRRAVRWYRGRGAVYAKFLLRRDTRAAFARRLLSQASSRPRVTWLIAAEGALCCLALRALRRPWAPAPETAVRGDVTASP